MLPRLLCIWLMLVTGAVLSRGAIQWHREGPVAWAELPVPSEGSTGFVRLSSLQTGLNFTNILTESDSAANRVLENGSGVAIGDYDHDGRPDVFFCSLTGQNALFRNLGDWKFHNVTAAAGLSGSEPVSRGAVFADVNGDGWTDLLVSTLASGVLCYLNDRQGKFENATRAAGTGTTLGSTTLALADVDGNGTLDLYVTNYRPDDIRDRSRIEVQRVQGKVVLAPWLRDRLVLTQQGVLEFGQPDVLYLNNGRGRFTPVSWTEGAFLDHDGNPLTVPPADWGLTATFRDLNGDGTPDLYVCNDYWTPDRIWLNDGRGQFKAISQYSVRRTSENSMGVDFADIDRDGHVDGLVLDMLSRDPRLRKRQILAQTRMPSEPGQISNRPQVMRNMLFHNRGDGTFQEIADYAGLAASDWSWQPVFIDVDLDGFEDVIISAGHQRDVQDLDATSRIRALQHPWPKGMDPKAHQEAFTREMMEHARLYPLLDLPVIAFRNLGNLKFKEMTEVWGTADLGVHQGIALGDLDGDGDLDLVVNNLNSACGVYRNESIEPRVAVQLRGLPPNTQGIGAQVILRGGAVPVQSQEIVSGGRYLSGFQPRLAFAAGQAVTNMSLEIRWRSGKRSFVEQVRPGRVYEIDEAGAKAAGKPADSQSASPKNPWFQDASHRLNHTHVENEFDDFLRQPLLPRKLSQLGPGICWFDLNEDGRDDLIIGSGRGGRLSVFQNTPAGFQLLTNAAVPPVARDQTGLAAFRTARNQVRVLAGSANYEDGEAAEPSVIQYDAGGKRVHDIFPGLPSSTGPLALADYDGDGDLDLFVGGRVRPGRYPEPADSTLFFQDNGEWKIDRENSRLLEKVGLVSGAVWSDLDGNGFPELILACEWNSIRIFQNDRGHLRDVTAARGVAHKTGWWTGISTGDMDGDGRLDIIASNWGCNSPHQVHPPRGVRLYFGDLLGRGVVDVVEAEWDAKRTLWATRHGLDFLAAGLPFLREQFPTVQSFSEATLDQVLNLLPRQATLLEASTLASTVFLNRGERFDAVELPREAQLAPAFSVNVADFDGDGHEDIFLSQNFFAFPWQFHRLDAGRGLLLQGLGDGRFRSVPGQESGIQVYGEQRGAAISDFDSDGRMDLAVCQNGAETKLYLNSTAKRGLRVRLIGPVGNVHGVGAILQLRFNDRFGPAREVHAGSGYGSQDTLVQVMATPEPPTALRVRWPGGTTTTRIVPPGAAEMTVAIDGLERVEK